MAIFTFYDIETNGLDRTSDILEFGFVRTDEYFKILNSGVLRFWQDGWRAGATDIHGLTEEILSPYKDKFIENMAQMYAIISDGILIGKNNHSFDDHVVMNFLQKYTPISGPLRNLQFVNFETSNIESHVAPIWREWYLNTYKTSAGRRKGTIEEYMVMYDMTQEDILNMLRSICSDESTLIRGYHSALYDAFATYVITYMTALKYHVYPKYA